MSAGLRAFVLVSLATLSISAPPAVKAALLEYELNLVASGSIDRGAGPTNFENLEILVTGTTSSDVDTRPEPDFGQYASSSPYDLGAPRAHSDRRSLQFRPHRRVRTGRPPVPG